MLANTSIISPSSFFVVGTVKHWTLSNFEIYNTVLLAVLLCCVLELQNLFFYAFCKFVPLNNISLIPEPPNSPASGNHHSTLRFYKFGFFFFFFLAMPCSLWDLIFSTRDWSWALSGESLESKPPKCQGVPLDFQYKWYYILFLFDSSAHGYPVYPTPLLNKYTTLIHWVYLAPGRILLDCKCKSLFLGVILFQCSKWLFLYQ